MRPPRRTRAAGLVLSPRGRSGVQLPELVATAPAGGWTLPGVLATARYYSERFSRPDLGDLTGAAVRALLAELPQLKRMEITERLHGVDPLAEAPNADAPF